MEKHSTLELRDILGPLKDLLVKLSGEDRDQQLRGLKKFLRGENPYLPFEILRENTIVLGNMPLSDLVTAIRRKHMNESSYMISMIGDLSVSPIEREVDLVFVPVWCLSGGIGAYPEKICKEALGFGLELCPAEVGPQLFLQTERIADKVKETFIGMSPVNVMCNSSRKLDCIFKVFKTRNKRSPVDFSWSYWDALYPKDALFAFINPRKEK
ncbi:MAG: hypothetical protein Q8O83_01315 [bacterium]|nr:hypothetical protein [bacterium]